MTFTSNVDVFSINSDFIKYIYDKIDYLCIIDKARYFEVRYYPLVKYNFS